MHHISWDLTCQADTLTIHMRFDDATGRLQSLTTDIPPHWSGRLVAPLETAAEARAVGLHRLYDLQMIPAGSHLTLTQSPLQIKPKSPLKTYQDWQMVWLVTPAEGDPPIQIRLILDRRSGLPIYCAARKWLNHNFRHFSVPIGWQHVASQHPRLLPNY
jgi:hypothetical protein